MIWAENRERKMQAKSSNTELNITDTGYPMDTTGTRQGASMGFCDQNNKTARAINDKFLSG